MKRPGPPPEPGVKWCGGCAQWRPVAEFARDRSRPDGLQAQCRHCRAAYKAGREFDVTVTEKRCSTCGITKPAADFARHRRKPDGLAYRCRECDSARKASRSFDVTVTEKRCPTCGITKPAAEFTRHRRKPDGLQAQCRPCRAAYQASRVAEAMVTGVCATGGCTTRWADQPSNTGPKCWQHAPAWVRRKFDEEPYYSLAIEHAHLVGLPPAECVYGPDGCSGPATHGDHILPKSVWGLHRTVANIVPACRNHNYAKAANEVHHWLHEPTDRLRAWIDASTGLRALLRLSGALEAWGIDP